MKQTTQKQYEAFQKCVRYWVDRLKIVGWELGFLHEPLERAYATISVNYLGRCVTFRFTSQLRDDLWPYTMAEIKKTAKHEVVHLFLAELYTLGCARFATEDEIDHAEIVVQRRRPK